MKKYIIRCSLFFAVVCVAIGLSSAVVARAEGEWYGPAREAVAQGIDSPRLSLAIHPGMVQVGELFSLKIEYHLVGQPDTVVHMDHPELVAYDPPLEMPCGFYTHVNYCTDITLRAVSSGVETFSAAAYGEITDELCGCFRWTSVYDDGVVSVVIVDRVWRVGLPTIWR